MSESVDKNYVDVYINDSRQLIIDLQRRNNQLLKAAAEDKRRIAELEAALANPQYGRFLRLSGILNRFGIFSRIAKKLLKGMYKIYKAVKNLLRRKKAEQPVADVVTLTPQINYQNPPQEYPVRVSVVIPTKNGGAIFERLMAQLVNQLGIAWMEIIVVDSGSTDRTVELVRHFGGSVIEIKPEEFSHSYARNLGAEHAQGDYILFMTQDAVPTDDYWLYKFITPLVEGKASAASAMEQQEDYGDLKYKIDNWSHNRYLGVHDRDKLGSLPKSGDWEKLRKNAQLADVSCLVRKDVFDRHGYQGDFAEDLRLGIEILREGGHVALLSSVRVTHAHSRIASYYMKRNYVDVRTIKDILPDYPVRRYTLAQTVGDIRQGYVFTQALLARIDVIGVVPETGAFFDRLAGETEAVSGNIHLEDVDYSNPYQDEYMMEFMKKIFTLECRSADARTDICRELAGYLNGPVRGYLCEKGQEIDTALISEIKETVYKTYCATVGTHLAEYSLVHRAGEDALMELVRDLGQGV